MVRLRVFGATTAQIDNGQSPTRLPGRSRQVLAILILQAGTPIAKDRLADLLWEGHPPAAYFGTLDSYICLLRRRLGHTAGSAPAIVTTPHGYLLDPAAAEVDLWEFQAAVTAAAGATAATAVRCAQEVLALVTGELLASEPYAPWSVRARQEFSKDLVTTCVRGAGLANGIGDFSAAVQLARAAVLHDRLNEGAWQHLMRGYWFGGLRIEALRAWSELRGAVLEELGEEPSRASRDLYLAILRDVSAERVDTSADDGGEHRLLLHQLRQVLDTAMGVHVPAQDSALVGAARMLLAAG